MKSSDREEFIERAMQEHESALIGYAKTFVHDLERARDVVQDTFIRLCRQEPEQIEDHLKSWLFTVCRNRCLDVLRKDRRMQTMDDDAWKKLESQQHSTAPTFENEDRLAVLLKQMDRLPKNQREVILLKFQQGMSYVEIQKITGLKEGNIGFMIHAGTKKLREWMKLSHE